MSNSLNFALYAPNFGKIFGDPNKVVQLAQTAEEAGWDGFFLWDHISLYKRGDKNPMVDPWTTLAAIATVTKKIKIGTTITPLSRRRPWKIAREIVTIDHLSKGRFILSVGLGFPPSSEFQSFGEEANPKIRAQMLDESLEILTGLLSGEIFKFKGEHYSIKEVKFLPKPVQSKIPIWVGGTWPNKLPFIRASKWDGVIPLKVGFKDSLSIDDFKAIQEFISKNRTSNAPFDVACIGYSPGKDPEKDKEAIKSYSQAGVNWWLESVGWRGSFQETKDLISQGPPQL
jgi:alkanesulfonate monooxygenase SsuD/methylene tetrahydromethanopterin reductase-like flavin-dependent oxidoreductase (luciferase family)